MKRRPQNRDFLAFVVRRFLRARRACGFSQSELAFQVDTTQSNIAKFESGQSLLSPHKLFKAAAVLGISLDEINREWAEREGIVTAEVVA
ncbi:MAG: helix-turn-helix transcriptional regulator [Planctomycetes bacterium]|nr:helix-turn-helix transcriptional regulator [Planctomycetota bacterium]